MHGILKLRKMVQDDPDMGWRERYGADGTEEVVPSCAPDAGAAERRRAARDPAVRRRCLTRPASS